MAQSDISRRLIPLAVLVGAANLWAERHLGYGLADPVGLLGLTGAVSAIAVALDWLVAEETRSAFKKETRAKIRSFVARPLFTHILVVLYLLGAVAAMIYSSVTVIPPRVGAAASVTITPIEEAAEATVGRLRPGDQPTRLLMGTNPLGRDLRLEVEGYVPKVVTLYPLGGLTIDPQNDLEPLITLLFRPPLDAMSTLNSGGRFVVFKITEEGCTLVGESSQTDSRPRAFIVGGQRGIPPSFVEAWNLELLASGAEAVNAAQTLQAWIRPESVATSALFGAGDRAYGLVLSRVQVPKAEVLYTIGREPFQDAPMQLITAPPKCVP